MISAVALVGFLAALPASFLAVVVGAGVVAAATVYVTPLTAKAKLSFAQAFRVKA